MATAAAGVRTREAKRVSVGNLVAIFVSVFVVGALAIAIANWNLDPLTYSTSYKRKVAETLESGKGFAIYDPTIEYRGLRREHLKIMKTPPDLMFFSGSRFELVHKGMFPADIKFYNSFFQRDYSDDIPAMAHILDSAGKLPKNLVVSPRLFSFRPQDDRPEGTNWKHFVPESVEMAKRLNHEPISRVKYFPYDHWLSLFSVQKLMQQIEMRRAAGDAKMGPTDAKSLPTMQILNPDGSLTFSEKHRKAFTPEFARADSAKKAAADRSKGVKKPDEKQLALFKSTIEFLVSKGVNVAVVVTPQHPAYWEGVAGSPYGQMLVDLEETVRKISTSAGAQFVGGFNPKKLGCPESAYRDFIHVENDCLKKVFDTIKLKR